MCFRSTVGGVLPLGIGVLEEEIGAPEKVASLTVVFVLSKILTTVDERRHCRTARR